MKYKIGDKVRIRHDLESGVRYPYIGGSLFCSDIMTKYKGMVATIAKTKSNYGVYEIDLDFQWDYWCEDMFVPISLNKYKIKGL